MMGFKKKDVMQWLEDSCNRLRHYEYREKYPEKYNLEAKIRYLNFLFDHGPDNFILNAEILSGVVVLVLLLLSMLLPSLSHLMGCLILGVGPIYLIYTVMISIHQYDELLEKERKEVAERRKALLEEYIRKYGHELKD
jgi:uncharacterized membrane protein YqjE